MVQKELLIIFFNKRYIFFIKPLIHFKKSKESYIK